MKSKLKVLLFNEHLRFNLNIVKYKFLNSNEVVNMKRERFK